MPLFQRSKLSLTIALFLIWVETSAIVACSKKSPAGPWRVPHRAVSFATILLIEMNLINVVYFLANGLLGAVGQMATAVAAPHAVSRWVLAATARKSKIAINRPVRRLRRTSRAVWICGPTGMIRQPSPTASGTAPR